MKKILTWETYIHYSNLSTSQSCVCAHVLLLVLWRLSTASSIYVLLKKTLMHCVHIFTDMAPICTVFQAPSRLTELSSAVIQVHREILPQRPYLRKPRERNELQVHWNLMKWRPPCYLCIYKNGGTFYPILSCKVLDSFVYLIMKLSHICLRDVYHTIESTIT